jgi:hypothetical protein
VDELGYGDCKALSNYTQSLLKAIDIPSNYTWVQAGTNPSPIFPDFPVDVFNHIILCVPNGQDSIWLECTSQTNPFGYQGTFTGDRDVLMITDDGAEIVHTTVYSKEDNTQRTHADVQVLDDGSAEADISIEYRGTQHENNNLNYIIDDGDEKLKNWIHKNTKTSEFTINDFEFEMKKGKLPSIEERLKIHISSLASTSGSRLFLVPNLLNRWTYSPKKVKGRKTAVVLTSEYQDYDSIVFNIPEKYHIEYIPDDFFIENDFGSYSSIMKFENNQLIYIRTMSRNNGRFPKEEYAKFREFYKMMVKADKAKVVFVNKS